MRGLRIGLVLQWIALSMLAVSACGDDAEGTEDEPEAEHDAGTTPPDGSASDASTDAGAGDGGAASADDPNSWHMMGYDSTNQYWNPAETELSPANAATLVEKWRFTVA